MPKTISLTALEGLPLIHAGDDLGALLAAGLRRASIVPADGDVVVVAQKIVSKAEGRSVNLADVVPSAGAVAIGEKVRKDPRLVELVLSESSEIIRQCPDVLIVAHRLGFVMANAGVDQSNVRHDAGDHALLLPRDPDASAAALREKLAAHFRRRLAVIITDSWGRAWRRGTVGVALGVAGLPALLDLRGRRDLFGRELRVTQTGFADEIAGAASLVMGQAAEARPAVLVRGLVWPDAAAGAATLIRPAEEDLFR
jgi:coenzyme F420-0:L-glutamate ligase/coenzyme F420-1:gamma-L-glutamate ligase